MSTANPMVSAQNKLVRSAQSPAASYAEERSSASNLVKILLLTAALAWVGYKISQGGYYTPRSTFGFYLGVTGTVMMLALLTYPLRKRARWMQRWGALKHWFRVHMWLGIIGPTLVLFHSTFHIRSTNAAVALFSMMFVVASGLIGRFVYTRIHSGLYGRRATLDKLQEEWRGHAKAAEDRLQFCPPVAAIVHEFERLALEDSPSATRRALTFATLGLRRQWANLRCSRHLRRSLREASNAVRQHNVSLALRILPPYLREVQQVAQFTAYERLFGLWHVLHVPLIFLLAASTVFHVLAVYMY